MGGLGGNYNRVLAAVRVVRTPVVAVGDAIAVAVAAVAIVVVITIRDAVAVAVAVRSAWRPVALYHLPAAIALVPGGRRIHVAGAFGDPYAGRPGVALAAPFPMAGRPDVAMARGAGTLSKRGGGGALPTTMLTPS